MNKNFIQQDFRQQFLVKSAQHSRNNGSQTQEADINRDQRARLARTRFYDESEADERRNRELGRQSVHGEGGCARLVL